MRPASNRIFRNRKANYLATWITCKAGAYLAPYRIGHKGVSLQGLLYRDDQVSGQAALGDITHGPGREGRSDKSRSS